MHCSSNSTALVRSLIETHVEDHFAYPAYLIFFPRPVLHTFFSPIISVLFPPYLELNSAPAPPSYCLFILICSRILAFWRSGVSGFRFFGLGPFFWVCFFWASGVLEFWRFGVGVLVFWRLGALGSLGFLCPSPRISTSLHLSSTPLIHPLRSASKLRHLVILATRER